MNGEVTHVLSIAIEPERFVDLMRAQNRSPEWVMTIVDKSDRVIARSRDHDRFVGQLAPEEFRRSETASSGVWVGSNLDAERVFGAYEGSPLTGWRAFVGVPLATVEGPVRQSLWLVAALGAWSLGLSYVLAVPFGRRITRSAQRLVSAAAALGRGEPIEPVRTGLREIDHVSDALASASVELQEREAALRASEERLRATHDNAAVGIIEVDQDGRILEVNEAECSLTGLTRGELVGRHFAHSTPSEDRERDMQLFMRQITGELPTYTIEKQHIRADGSMGWVRVSSTAVRNERGTFLHAVRVVEDVSERKQAETQQRLLVEELNHRVKNTLATVQSLAFQTFKHTGSAGAARERFEARLISLSRTHNLLNQSSWTGAPLKQVIAVELEPYASGRGQRIGVTGADLDLPPSAALAFGMTFHELATNAAKYGALSLAQGRVEVSWAVSESESGRRNLKLRWIERNGPTVDSPSESGFGSRLIDQIVRHQLNGRCNLRFEPEGLVCDLEIPLDNIEQTANAAE